MLYDTYGFPLDLTKEILEEKGYSIDEDGFKAAMEEQRVKARTSRKVSNYMGKDATVYDEIDPSITSEFLGYDKLSYESDITVLTTETEVADAVSDGDKATIFVEQTPFYATMGGQEGDTGVIRTADAEFKVEETIKLLGGKIGHVGYVTKGMFKVGESDTGSCTEERADTCKNHSATHLLAESTQSRTRKPCRTERFPGNPDRLRFDFTHFEAMTAEEIAKTEALVNKEIQANLPVVTKIMNIDEAKKNRSNGTRLERNIRKRTCCIHGRLLHRALRRYPCGKYRRDPGYSRSYPRQVLHPV